VVVDGVHGVDPAAVPGRVLECVLQCAVAAVRRVHTDDHLVPLVVPAPDDDHRARRVCGDLRADRTEHQPLEPAGATRTEHDLLRAGSQPDEFGGRVAVRDLTRGVDRRGVPDPDQRTVDHATAVRTCGLPEFLRQRHIGERRDVADVADGHPQTGRGRVGGRPLGGPQARLRSVDADQDKASAVCHLMPPTSL
jgi:hypothetical protein